MLKSYWDHSGKPSVFVVTEDGKEIYRGPFKEGYEIYRQKVSLKFKNCEANQVTLELPCKR